MTSTIRRTPLDLPRENLFRKSYTALIRSDGTLLPIEERLGKRLLRTLAPDSREARELLRSGCVTLLTTEGERLLDEPADVVYERLSVRVRTRLAEPQTTPAHRRRCREVLAEIERHRRALARDH